MKKRLPGNNLPVSCLAVAACLLLHSCMKDNFDFNKLASSEWKPDIALPLVKSSLSVKDLVNKVDTGGFVSEDANHFLTVIYQGLLNSPAANDLFPIPTSSIIIQSSLSAAEVTQLQSGSTVNQPYSGTIDMGFPTGVVIDTIRLKSGTFNLSISSDFQQNAQIILTFPAMKKNGLPFVQTIPVTYTGSPININTNYDLTGYSMDFTGGGSSNKLPYDMQVSFNYISGNPVSTSEMMSVGLSFTDIKFSYIDGYLGQLPFALKPDSFEVAFFKSLSGTISLADPKLKINISNSFGLPIQINYVYLDANTKSGGLMPVTSSYLPGPFVFNYPTFAQIGQTSLTNFLIDKNSSNLTSIIAASPTQITYSVSATSNPNGNIANNFMTDSSKFDINMVVEIPLWGTAANFAFTDTMDFSFGTVDEIEWVLIKLNINNGLPLDAGVQVYCTDTLYNKLDSLIVPYDLLIKSGITDVNGKVIQATNKATEIKIDSSRMTRLADTKKLLIQANMATYQSGTTPVKIHSTDKIDVKLSARAQLKIKIKK